MKTISITLTIFFDDQFWVGVFEKQENNKLSVARHIFGAEPKDGEILELICKRFYSLRFSPHVVGYKSILKKSNPKTTQRKIKKVINKQGIGTKSQQAIKLQIEQSKIERKIKNKEKTEKEKQELFILKQKIKHEKHKGH